MLNRKFLCTALVAAFASAGLSAHAQDRDEMHRDQYQQQYQRQDQHDQYQRERREHRMLERRRDERRHERWAEHRDDGRVMGGPEGHRWHRGDRLPDEYRHHGYVNWRYHHLHRPPRGYEWVDVDGNYALVAIGSGVIANMIVHH